MTVLRPGPAFIASLIIVGHLLVCDIPAVAHTLDVTTARVELREGHAEIFAEVDFLRVLESLAPDTPNAATIATAPEEVLEHYLSNARTRIEQESLLLSSTGPVPLHVQSFPTPSEVRIASTRRAADANAHPAMTTLRFESTASLLYTKDVRVSFPRAFGSVLVTFVQPRTQLSPVGASASFDVLVPASEGAVDPAPTAGRWPAWAAIVLSVFAVAVHLWPRKRAQSATLPADPGAAT